MELFGWGLLGLYLLILNLISFSAMALDKRRARRGVWRIPERTLLLLAFLGGSLGALCGMLLFRHKTKHLKFTLTVPLFFVLHATVTCFLFLYCRPGL